MSWSLVDCSLAEQELHQAGSLACKHTDMYRFHKLCTLKADFTVLYSTRFL